MNGRRSTTWNAPSKMRGLTLIELMIALLLGLLVVGAAVGIFLSNKRAYDTTEGLGRVQESVRTAFELMARDIREAGGNPCDVDLPFANVINSGAADWWTNWGTGLRGYDGAGLPDDPASTDEIQLLSAGDESVTVTSHAGTAFTVPAVPAHRYVAGQSLIVCDTRQLAVFTASGVTATTIEHEVSGGNCDASLGIVPSACGSSKPAYAFPRNAVLSQMHAARWYVASNGRGGTSLYQALNGGVGQEVAEGVSGLQLTYLQLDANPTEYVPATAVTNWGQVRAVRIVMTLQGVAALSTNGLPLSRNLEHVVTLRNRNL